MEFKAIVDDKILKDHLEIKLKAKITSMTSSLLRDKEYFFRQIGVDIDKIVETKITEVFESYNVADKIKNYIRKKIHDLGDEGIKYIVLQDLVKEIKEEVKCELKKEINEQWNAQERFKDIMGGQK